MSKKLTLKSTWQHHKVEALILVAILIVTGFVLILARAAQPASAVEAESATPVTNAKIITDATASAGRAIQFTAPIVTPPTGYPNGDNTGYKHLLSTCPGGVLKQYSGDKAASDFVGAGGTISCVQITGALNINLANVTVTKSWIYGKINCNIGQSATLNATISDSEIGGPLGSRYGDEAVEYWSYTLLRDDIHGFGDGPRVNGDNLVQDNYIHDLFIQPDDHNDDIQITGGSNVRIIHNTLFLHNTETSSVQIGADTGDVSGVTVDNNLVAGGGYSIYGGARPPAGRNVSNITITNNVVSTIYYPNGGQFGPIVNVQPGTTFSNNTWYDGANKGKVIANPGPGG